MALVALVSVVTAIPPLWLALSSAPSDSTAHALTRAADLTDAVLFVVVGLFALELLRDTEIGWLKTLSLVVAGLSLVRAVLGLLGISILDAVAPLAFVVLILVVSIECLGADSAWPPQRSADASAGHATQESVRVGPMAHLRPKQHRWPTRRRLAVT